KAERVLREAISTAHDNWGCWAGLGELLDQKAGHAVLGDSTNGPASSHPNSVGLSTPPSKPLPAERREDAEDYLAEADRCFAHAVALAPKDGEVALARVSHVMLSSILKWSLLNSIDRQESVTEEAREVMGSSEACEAWANAVRLNPTN